MRPFLYFNRKEFYFMSDKIIHSTDIFLQDVVCSVVLKNPQKNHFELYDLVSEMVDIPDISVMKKIFMLIKQNKMALTD